MPLYQQNKPTTFKNLETMNTPIKNAKFDLYLRLKKYVSMELAHALSQCLDFVRIEKILKDAKDLTKLSYWKQRILDFMQPSCN